MFSDYLIHKDKYIQMGINSHNWMMQNAIEKPLNAVIAAIEEKRKIRF